VIFLPDILLGLGLLLLFRLQGASPDRMKWLSAVAILFLTSSPSLSGNGQVFDVRAVVGGVYAAIPRPQYVNNCDAAIILLDDGVVVVDSHSAPSVARALISQIKTLTDKPVKYVVDTHFHFDHFRGNQAYLKVWPQDAEIIASEATRESIERRGVPRLKNEIVTLPQRIENLKADLAKATEAKQKEKLEKGLRVQEDYLAELKTMQATLPTLTFERSLVLHRMSRTVEILWLGKAHTDGDVFVYLPRERLLVTGGRSE